MHRFTAGGHTVHANRNGLQPSSFLLLVVRPGAPSSFLLLVMASNLLCICIHSRLALFLPRCGCQMLNVLIRNHRGAGAWRVATLVRRVAGVVCRDWAVLVGLMAARPAVSVPAVRLSRLRATHAQ